VFRPISRQLTGSETTFRAPSRQLSRLQIHVFRTPQTFPTVCGSFTERRQPMAYTVRSGDSMSAIAARHNVALSALLKANPQVKNANKIYPGQKLNIPGRKDDFVAAPAKSTTTSSSGT